MAALSLGAVGVKQGTSALRTGTLYIPQFVLPNHYNLVSSSGGAVTWSGGFATSGVLASIPVSASTYQFTQAVWTTSIAQGAYATKLYVRLASTASVASSSGLTCASMQIVGTTQRGVGVYETLNSLTQTSTQASKYAYAQVSKIKILTCQGGTAATTLRALVWMSPFIGLPFDIRSAQNIQAICYGEGNLPARYSTTVPNGPVLFPRCLQTRYINTASIDTNVATISLNQATNTSWSTGYGPVPGESVQIRYLAPNW